MPMRWRARVPLSPPGRRGRPSPREGASSWPSAAGVPRGRCCGRWPFSRCRGADLQIVQVDERVAPDGHPERNLTHVRESLLAHCPLRPEQVHAMPVEAANIEVARQQYATALRQIAGAPVVLDLVHLDLGPDGHMVSLVPGDPVLDVTDADVAVTGPYQGRRRMTLTYPILNRARRIVWLVTGREKAEMVARLYESDRSIPAGRVRQHAVVVLADQDAAAALGRVASRR